MIWSSRHPHWLAAHPTPPAPSQQSAPPAKIPRFPAARTAPPSSPLSASVSYRTLAAPPNFLIASRPSCLLLYRREVPGEISLAAESPPSRSQHAPDVECV